MERFECQFPSGKVNYLNHSIEFYFRNIQIEKVIENFHKTTFFYSPEGIHFCYQRLRAF